MGSKVKGVYSRPNRAINYPFQLVAMVDGMTDEAVRAYAARHRISIAEAMRRLLDAGMKSEAKRERRLGAVSA